MYKCIRKLFLFSDTNTTEELLQMYWNETNSRNQQSQSVSKKLNLQKFET
jgi:hypothetical protein